MRAVLIVMMLVVGMLLPIQVGANAEFRRHAGHPLQAAGLNMLIGAIAVLAVLAMLRVPPPGRAAFASAPWWSLIGGLIGGTVVFTSLVAAPRLGAVLLIATLMCGQLASSTVLDHFGWVGYPVRPITPLRVLGLVLLVAGLVLVERTSTP